MRTKIFTLLFAIVAGINAIWASNTQVDGIWYDFNTGNHTATVTYRGSSSSEFTDEYSGIVTIPSSVNYNEETYSVTSIRHEAFRECSGMTSIIIPNSVTSIGNYAFESCSGLAAVTIPNSVTSVEIGAFENCPGLTDMTIPDGVISIRERAFNNCVGLTSVAIPNSVTSIGNYAFNNCAGLTSIIIPNSVELIGNNAFEGCYNMTSVTILDGTTTIGNAAFASCVSLKSVTFPNTLNTIGSSAFKNCSTLEAISIPNSIMNIGNEAFYGCLLTSITLEDGLATLSAGAFKGCSAVDTLTIPASVQAIEAEALPTIPIIRFRGATPPTVNTFPFFGIALVPTEAVETYRTAWPDYANSIIADEPEAYTNTISVTANASQSAIHLEIGEENLGTVISLKVTGTINAYDLMVLNNKMTALKYLDLSDADIVATTNGYEYHTGYTTVDSVLTAYSFRSGNVKLLSLKLPNSLKRIDANACIGHSTLTYLDLGTGAKTIGDYAFKDCSRLCAANIGDSVTSIGQEAFYNCSLVRVISIGENVTSIGIRAFQKCKNVHNFIWNAKRYTTAINNWGSNHPFIFAGNDCINCYDRMANLDSLIIGSAVEELPEDFFNVDAFRGARLINTVVVGEKIRRFGNNVFRDSEEDYRRSVIKKVVYQGTAEDWLKIQFGTPSSNPIYYAGNLYVSDTLLTNLVVSDSIEKVNAYSFDGCATIKRIRFSSKLKNIETYAFRNCSNLEEVRLPSSLLSIGDGAFDGCGNIQNVYTYTVEPVTINQNTFSCWNTAMLNVPYTSRYIYWYNTEWSQFIHSQEFDEPYDYFYVNGDVELSEELGTIDGAPDADLNPGSGLIVSGDEIVQDAGTITIGSDENGIASILACSDNLTADTLVINLVLTKGQWSYFCFPFDILLEQISYAHQYVIREYNGATRAQYGSGGWVNLIGDMLQKGIGYIFQGAQTDTITFRVPNPQIECEEYARQIQAYNSANNVNANWNFIGNPYPSWYDLDGLFNLGYTSPIYTWNGLDYQVYTPGDDEYHMHPYEGFFTQNPSTTGMNVNWHKDGRETQKQAHNKQNGHHMPARKAARRARQAADHRQLINLELVSDDYTDRTRIVFNEVASTDYELGRDAVLMNGGGAPLHIWSIAQDNNRLSINERPYGTGRVELGYYVKEDGFYTLSASRMDTAVIIYDNELQQEVDLSECDYVFNTSAGTNTTRFSIIRAKEQQEEPQGIEETMDNLDEMVSVYNMLGVKVLENVRRNDIHLGTGVYIVENNTGTRTELTIE